MAIKEIQSILDGCLLSRGILSHPLRRADVDKRTDGGKIDPDKYVIYRRVTSGGRVYGNGKSIIGRTAYDVNLYYVKGLKASDIDKATAIMKDIESAFIASGWYVGNGQNDLYDNDLTQNGINIEVAQLEA